MMALLDTKYKRVSDCIASGAVIFLGTPHRGSESVTSLHRILSATIGSKAFVQELMRNSSTLTAINEDFRHYAADLSIWSFHETQPTTFAPGKSAVSLCYLWIRPFPYAHTASDCCRAELGHSRV